MGNRFSKKINAPKHTRLERENTEPEFHGVPVEDTDQSRVRMNQSDDDQHNQMGRTVSTRFVTNNLYSEVRLDKIKLPPACKDRTRLTTDYKVAVAIDFGTSFSGYAYSYKESPNIIHLNDNWGAEVGMKSYKTPTCICLDSSKNIRGFGYNAHYHFEHDERENGNYQLYQRFKMQLHEKRQQIASGIKLTSDDGIEVDGKAIFAEALKYLKDHFLEVTNRAGSISSVDDVLWVLTVPAIWSDHEKMFMTEAAVQAGLVRNAGSDRLMIALEPEAASLYCRTRYDEKLKPGHKYIVIDAGGGTVDIAVHKIESDGSCVELHEPSGGLWGGDRINEGVEQLLTRVLGDAFMKCYKTKYQLNWFQFVCNFEKQKAEYHDFSKSISIPLGMCFDECYQEVMGRSLKEALADADITKQGLSLSKNLQLQIGGKQLKEIYDKEINEIIRHIQEDLLNEPNCAGMKTIMLVGGFGHCKYFYSSIKGTFGQKYDVLQPEEANLAVLKGAVLFAHRPNFIRTRISPYTYAVLHHGNIPQSDVDMKRISGKFYRCLKPIIMKGEHVEINTIKEEYGTPAEYYMNTVEVELFSSVNPEKYFNDNPEADSNNKVGKVIVKCSPLSKNRIIKILFIFGCTYIRVKVENSDGEEAEANFSYNN